MKLALLSSLLLSLGALVGCGGPRVVTQMTSAEGELKMAYHKESAGGAEQGLVRCQLAEDGTITRCVELPIDYEE